jgi:hypothetical protein
LLYYYICYKLRGYSEIHKNPKDKVAGTCEENGSGSNAERDDGRKIVHRKKKRKTPSEMDGRCSRLENNEDKAVDEEDKNREQWRLVVEEAKAYPGL